MYRTSPTSSPALSTYADPEAGLPRASCMLRSVFCVYEQITHRRALGRARRLIHCAEPAWSPGAARIRWGTSDNNRPRQVLQAHCLRAKKIPRGNPSWNRLAVRSARV